MARAAFLHDVTARSADIAGVPDPGADTGAKAGARGGAVSWLRIWHPPVLSVLAHGLFCALVLLAIAVVVANASAGGSKAFERERDGWLMAWAGKPVTGKHRLAGADMRTCAPRCAPVAGSSEMPKPATGLDTGPGGDAARQAATGGACPGGVAPVPAGDGAGHGSAHRGTHGLWQERLIALTSENAARTAHGHAADSACEAGVDCPQPALHAGSAAALAPIGRARWDEPNGNPPRSRLTQVPLPPPRKAAA